MMCWKPEDNGGYGSAGADPMEIMRASDSLCRKRVSGRGQAGRALPGRGSRGKAGLSPLGETIRLEKNMVVSFHPTVHGKNAWGYPVNQSFLITADGPKIMTKTRRR